MDAIKLSEKYKTLLNKWEINTPLRRAHFFAQIDHESNFIPKSENLNYSTKRLLEVFRKYFNTNTASVYARKPTHIANKVYANRMGNGNESSGDGWKYRGRGFIQLTGKYNYSELSKATGIDYVKNPELLTNEADALISALWYWKVNNINKYADADNIDKVSDVVNIGSPTVKIGDANGFIDRVNKLKMYKKIFV